MAAEAEDSIGITVLHVNETLESNPLRNIGTEHLVRTKRPSMDYYAQYATIGIAGCFSVFIRLAFSLN